ncbi:MAG: Type III restriction protein res subunit [Desulfofundulus kuznetsovii]|nr:MAG: Type III restriction protein res subunit [Desulfotomaculum sp. 46_80]KUK84935.1 MAG: Type III restriction protein res subunit [Desulfofundulus kuznetsovii]
MYIKPGKYVHFKGSEYDVIGTATHSETLEEVVIYRALYGDGGLWARPAAMWNEIVEHNGRHVKRFTHIDEVVQEPPTGIHNHSTPTEKVELFVSLFAGCDDVYAKRWENAKKGSAGYVPVCQNEWLPLCPKSGGGKIKCGECPNQNFVKYDAGAVEKHLKGQLTAGVYPMFSDETCKFLAFDFDGKDYSPEDLRRDVTAIREACAEKGISMAVERSRSGKGFHFWMFFAENIPTGTARKFGSSLITHAMSKHHALSFKTYDRMIPNQDTLPKGGFGNLIALPLQKIPREHGNSVFVDENFNAYADQWNYLYNVKKYTLEETESFIKQLSPSGELGDLRRDSEEEKPLEGKKPEQKLTRFDFPDTVKIVLANMLYVEKSGISSPALNALKRLAAFRNPEFYKAQAMRLSTFDKPRIISCSYETGQYLCLPRGLEDDVCELLEDNGVRIQFNDETNKGRKLDVRFKGDLRGEQQQAADALLAHNNGILSAATAFGKTVIGARLIADCKVNTLILVHRTNLLSQWIERMNEFLIINEEPVIELTPKRRKRKKSIIGQIGGGKNNPGEIIDVAVMQSLVSGDEVKEIVRNYGMIIVDECHHVSAFSFEQILKTANAKYVYGLTATPTRQDGHHPIIYMQCGKIRYRVDAKEQAAARPFEHFVIPRFTRFQKPAHQDESKWTITDIYNDIQNSELRNSLIIQDVTAAVEQGRNPIILTERTGHVKYLASQLKPRIKNVIALTGGETQKKSRETLKTVAGIAEDESFVLVATGKYVGEGFDMPRLDTLFLAMPISWKGTLQQYAGRLHRLYEGKNEVQVYDYVDVHVAMLEKMYQKRLRGYAAIGYKAKGTPQPLEEVHSIFDSHTFFPVYSVDILAAQTEILIVSPFVTKRRVLSALNYLAAASAKITVVTKPPGNYVEKDRVKIAECIELLTQHGIIVKTKDRIHQKFAIMDQRVVWYGSINFLSYGTSEESIMRIENMDIAGELMRSI